MFFILFCLYELRNSIYFSYLKDKALTEEEKKNRKKAERERKRQEARENAEKKKRFGLTPEKKRKLKLLIMTKAAEALKMEQEKKARAKQDYMDSKVKPLPNVDSMNEANLVSICKDLHAQILAAEEQKYDSEMKIRKQDYEVKRFLLYFKENRNILNKRYFNK